MSMLRYCESPFSFRRRRSREVIVGDPARGGVIIGGDHPVVMQSMITCDTMDTAECVKQTLELVAVGCQIVRITAPTVKDAANLKNIVAELRARGCQVPIVADIHFKPEAALEAAKWVEMVRVNPGNYADSKKFAIKEYSDEQYAAELARIEEKFTPAGEAVPGAGPRHAHRHQPRLPERPHHEPVRRLAAGHGRERAGVRPHRPQARLPQLQVLHEVQQPEDHDPVLSVAGRAPGAGRAGLELPDSPGRHRSGRGRGRAHQERHRHRLAAVRRAGRHHPGFAHRGFPAGDRSLPRLAGAGPIPHVSDVRTSDFRLLRLLAFRSLHLHAPAHAGD